jgi:plasmid stability protein
MIPPLAIGRSGEEKFIPAEVKRIVWIKQSSNRALKTCAAKHNMTMAALARKLLEDAIFREAQSHNCTISSEKL